MITAKQITSEVEEVKEAQKEYEFYEERDAIDTSDKAVKIKVRVDTATKESLEADKAHLQELIDKIDSKLSAISSIK